MKRGDWRTDVVVVLCAALVAICVGAVQSAERVIYVDAAATGAGDGSSWADAYRDLQDALAEASEAPPAVIRVAQGTYRPGPPMGATPQSWNATFQLHNHAVLEGGHAGVAGTDPNARDVERYRTILSGDLAGDDTPGEDRHSPARMDNCDVVVTGSGIDESTVIDGFVITAAIRCGMRIQAGSPRIARSRFVDNASTGIDAWDCNSVLAECVFERNSRASSGYGFSSVRGNLTLTDCVFAENGGGGIRGTGTLNLLRCSFTDNTSFFGGAVESAGDLTARKCSFRSNDGLAIFCSGNTTLAGCEFTGNSSWNSGAIEARGSLTLVDCWFARNSAGLFGGGAVTVFDALLEAHNCVFAGNSGNRGPGAIAASSALVVRVSNCTFIGNRGQPNAVRTSPTLGLRVPELTRCIVRDGPGPFTVPPRPPQTLVTYSNVEGGYPGEGNIDVDPLFVDPGHWDMKGTPQNVDDDTWVTGDYHLKSQAGHWDRAAESWVFDEVTSPCIDAGDPNAPLGDEPFPNGGYVNMGAYGGTAEASRSYFGEPVCETRIAGDINGDCRVDDLDMDILMSHWLMPDIGKPNVPPIVALTSPEDGAELIAPMPIILQAEASDVDGTVLQVRYTLEYRSETANVVLRTTSTDPTNDWQGRWDWSHVDHDGTYTISAEATDDDGAITVSPKIHVILNR